MEVDIGNMAPDDPAISATLQRIQAQYAPNPVQKMGQALAEPAAAVRDVATGAVAGGLNAVGRAGLAGIEGLESITGTSLPAGQHEIDVRAIDATAQGIARTVVPQTPEQVVQQAALMALGPFTGTGLGGAFARAILPTVAGQATKYLIEEGVDQTALLTEVLPAALTEGAWKVIPKGKTFKATQAQRDAVTNIEVAALGGELEKISSVKHLKTPYDLLEAMSTKGAVKPTPHDTMFQKEISANIGRAQEDIERALAPSIAQLPPGQRNTVMAMLEDVAGVSPTMATPPGAPPSLAAPVTRVFNRTPGELFQKGLVRLREVVKAMDEAEGVDKFKLAEEYGKMREAMQGALSAIHPALGRQYDRMNLQFARDLDVRNLLWRIREEGAVFSDTKGVHVNKAKLEEIMQDAQRFADDYGLFGGVPGASRDGAVRLMRHIAGPSGVPGARATMHEGYARLFTQFPFSPLAVSMAQQPQLLRTPQGPLPTATALAASDLLSQIAAKGAGNLLSLGEEER